MRARLAGALVSVLALTLTVTACGGGGTKAPAAATTTAANRVEPLTGTPEPDLPVTVASADGKKVTVSAARRIVPLSGSLSEIVFTLGLGDRVVARDITATFQQAAKLPVVTRNHDVSAESVLSLKPDLVLAEATTGPAAVQKAVPTHKDKPRVTFLYLRGSASVYLIGGKGSGATSLLEAAGAVDAGAESGLDKDFTAITTEALAKAAPDAILVMTKGLESVGGMDGLVKIPGVAQTPAGMNRRVVSIEDGVLLNYGPRTDQVLKSIVDQLYGDGDAK